MEKEKKPLDERKFSKYFLIAVFILSLLAFLAIIHYFVLQILLAIIISILIYPFYKLLLKMTRNKRGIASLICCLLILISIFVPLLFISQILLTQSIELYQNTRPFVNEIIQKGNTGLIGKIMGTYLGKWILAHKIVIDWQAILEKIINFLGSSLALIINKTSKLTAGLIFDFFITFFSLFYFLRDGEKILSKIREIIPMSEEYKDRIIDRFYSMSNATVKGVLLIALLQSSLATLTLWIFGIKTWLLWGIVMLVLSVIPFAGTGVVLIPAGIIKIITGSVWQGIFIIAISIFFISVLDNLLRPRIVGRRAGMHDLLVFFSIIGGIMTFGPAGFIIGPLIAAVFLSILEIYKIEFQSYIQYSNSTRQE